MVVNGTADISASSPVSAFNNARDGVAWTVASEKPTQDDAALRGRLHSRHGPRNMAEIEKALAKATNKREELQNQRLEKERAHLARVSVYFVHKITGTA